MLESLLGLAAAASAAAYTPPRAIGDVTAWIGPNDYPVASRRASERGYVPFSITVSPQGLPVGCKAFTRSKPLRQSACRALLQRARFAPARDAAGLNAYGVFEHLVAFKMGGLSMPERPARIDMVLTVDRLPSPGFGPVVPIAFLVGEDGRIGGCNASYGHPVTDPLATIACDEARRTVHPAIAADAGGGYVASVQTLWVRFQSAPALSEPTGR